VLVFSDAATSSAPSAATNGDPLPHPAEVAGPDTVDEPDVSHPRPDPAAAIDWLLEKRRQQSD
jgi:hypothetical protein